MSRTYAIFCATDGDRWNEEGLAHGEHSAMRRLSNHKRNVCIAVAVPWMDNRHLPASLSTHDIKRIPGVIWQSAASLKAEVK